MGIGIDYLKFIFDRVHDLKPGATIVTIGRLNSFLRTGASKALFSERGISLEQFPIWGVDFIDDVLGNAFPGTKIQSMDYSDYEGANLIHDLNEPLPKNLQATADVIIDGGTIEHVFDVPQVLRNYCDLLKVGGQLIISTPSNNLQGHGFYQFSAELFYSYFNAERGFEIDQIVMAFHPYPGTELGRAKMFLVAHPSELRQRIMLTNRRPTMIYASVRKVAEVKNTRVIPILQSDYVVTYENQGVSQVGPIKRFVKSLPYWIRRHVIGLGQRYWFSRFNRRFYKPWRPGL